MEILHTRTWLLQLYIIHETKTDWEKSFKKTVETISRRFNFDVDVTP